MPLLLGLGKVSNSHNLGGREMLLPCPFTRRETFHACFQTGINQIHLSDVSWILPTGDERQDRMSAGQDLDQRGFSRVVDLYDFRALLHFFWFDLMVRSVVEFGSERHVCTSRVRRVMSCFF